MGEGDQVNIFFLLLIGEVGGWACPCLESSPRWQVKMVGPELGTVLSPKSHGEGGPWCATLWASWQLSVHPCPSEPGQKNVGEAVRLGRALLHHLVKRVLGSWFTCLPCIVPLPPRGS